MMLLALTLSFSAFTALSLAMEKHQHDLHGKAAAPPGSLGVADAELLRHLLQRCALQFGEKFVGEAHLRNP